MLTKNGDFFQNTAFGAVRKFSATANSRLGNVRSVGGYFSVTSYFGDKVTRRRSPKRLRVCGRLARGECPPFGLCAPRTFYIPRSGLAFGNALASRPPAVGAGRIARREQGADREQVRRSGGYRYADGTLFLKRIPLCQALRKWLRHA